MSAIGTGPDRTRQHWNPGTLMHWASRIAGRTGRAFGQGRFPKL